MIAVKHAGKDLNLIYSWVSWCSSIEASCLLCLAAWQLQIRLSLSFSCVLLHGSKWVWCLFWFHVEITWVLTFCDWVISNLRAECCHTPFSNHMTTSLKASSDRCSDGKNVQSPDLTFFVTCVLTYSDCPGPRGGRSHRGLAPPLCCSGGVTDSWHLRGTENK